MNMFAMFDENPAMTLQDIKETKRYGRTAMFDENSAMTLQDIKETKRYRRTDARTHGQRENSLPTTKFAGGGIIIYCI